MEGDTGYHLRVMATYTDAVGTDTAMEYSPATMMVMVTSNNAPDSRMPEHGYDDQNGGGEQRVENVGAPVMAMTTDDTLTYGLGRHGHGSWRIDMATAS